MAMFSPLGRRAIIPTARLLTPHCVRNTRRASPARRWSSSAQKCVVVSSVGVDRPGIVADITEIVTAAGGNVGESHSQLLGGHFSLLMLVEMAPPGGGDALRQRLQAGVAGMTTSCFDAADPKKVEVSPKIGFAGHFKLSGADNPGLVHKLTSVLARSSLTIGRMKTSQEAAPHGGTELFTMEGRAIAYEPLAANFDVAQLEEQLQELAESLNCDVDFEDVS